MKLITPVAILILTFCTSSPTFAQAGSCGDLWYRRNAEFKAAGYCFRTARAIQAFGNAGCAYDDLDAVPLSPYQRATVADIVAQEREMGCR